MHDDNARAYEPPFAGEVAATEAETAVTLEQLLHKAQNLCGEASAQFKGIGELAFLEFELALESFKWAVWALVMFSAASLLACTFLLVAAILALTGESSAIAFAFMLCGLVTAASAVGLFLALKSLTRKMHFTHLRRHLNRPEHE